MKEHRFSNGTVEKIFQRVISICLILALLMSISAMSVTTVYAVEDVHDHEEHLHQQEESLPDLTPWEDLQDIHSNPPELTPQPEEPTIQPDDATQTPAKVIAEGVCGKDATWTLYENGTLTISGTGEIANLDAYSSVSWSKYKSSIRTVIIHEGIVGIDGGIFNSHTNLSSIRLPSSLEYIDGSSFNGCTALASVHISDLRAWCNINFSDYGGNPLSFAKSLYLNGELITDLVIPDGITSIKNFTFYNCTSLTSVVIPEGISSIGQEAFYRCERLVNVSIPNSLISVGPYAFYNCSELAYSIYDTAKYLGNKQNPYVLVCESTNDYITSCIIHPDAKVIGSYAFMGCDSLANITIPEGVITIGTWAFNGCKQLTHVTIPNSVQTLEDGAFRYCEKLSELTIGTGVISIGVDAFYQCKKLTNVAIPDSVRIIGDYAFEYCSNLTNISIPSSVTSLGKGVFTGCYYLQYTQYDSASYLGNEQNPYVVLMSANSNSSSCSIHPNAKFIYEEAFANCSQLTSITIPYGVLSIGRYAFSNCRNLVSVYISESVTSIDNHAFNYCSSLTSISIPNGVISIGEYAFSNCTQLRSITIPASLCSIGANAFDSCSKLTSVDIWDISAWCNIDFGGLYANPLYYAKKLYCNGSLVKNLVIPDSTTSIGAFAFINSTSLTSITIPEGVTAIGHYAFYRCQQLNSIVIPNSVTSIGDAAFSYCTQLTHVYISDLTAWCKISFGSLDANPLFYAANLYLNGQLVTDLVIPDGIRVLSDCVFAYYKSLTTVTLPNSVIVIGADAFVNCSQLRSISLSEKIIFIGRYAFNNCSSLIGITIPDTVTCIDYHAFGYCTSLNSIVIGDALTNIASSAFSGCSNLWHVLYKGTEDQWNNIIIENYNDPFKNATRHYNCVGDEIIDPVNKLCALCCAHERGEEVTVPATCTENGYVGYICKICGYVVKEKTLLFTGHAFGDWIVDQEPTCDVPGSRHRTCSKCGETEVEELIAQHQYGPWIMTGYWTCTEPGSRYHICYLCGYREDDIIPPTGHKYEPVVTAPTCTEDGYTTYTCHCGDNYVADIVPAVGHLFIGADCLNCDAVDETFQNPTCGTTSDIIFERMLALRDHFPEGMPWTNDNYYAWNGGVYTGGYGCAGFAFMLSDAAFGTLPSKVITGVITIDQIRVGDILRLYNDTHSVIVLEVYEGRIVIAEGNYNSSIHWGRTLSASDIIADVDYIMTRYPAHAYTEEVFAPTCTAQGYTMHTCSVCGDQYADSYVDALGHDYEGGVCKNCGHIDWPINGTCGDGLYWSLSEDGTLTISGTGDMQDYIWNNAPWSAYSASITALVIEGGITGIGDYAFASCSSLTQITIPASVTSIGSYAFVGCTALIQITFVGEAPIIQSNAFSGVIATVLYPACNRSWAADVQQNYGGNLTWETYNNGHQYDDWITDAAPTCTDPGSKHRVCAYCDDVDTVQIPATGHTYIDGVCHCGDIDWPLSGKCGDNLTWVLTADGTLTISGSGAMYDYSDENRAPWHRFAAYIRKVVITNGVTTIGANAFCGCAHMTTIIIADSVTEIKDTAFFGCSSLTSITLPGSLVSIGSSIFNGCSGLTEIVIPEGVISIGPGAFSGCTELISITIPSTVIEIGSDAFSDCENLTTLVLPGLLTHIGDNAFAGCTALTSIVIPASVISIGKNAFAGCTALAKITFLGEAPTIGENAFGSVNATVFYPACNKTWAAEVRQNYGGSLTWVTYENGHNFGDWLTDPAPTCTESGSKHRTCSYCGKVESVEIPATGHDYDAVVTDPTCTARGYTTYFCHCGYSFVDNYTDMIPHNYVNGVCLGCGNISWPITGVCGEHAYWSLTEDGLLTIYGTGKMYDYTYSDETPWYAYEDDIRSIVVESGITSIGNYAFADLLRCKSVQIANGVTSIGEYAFSTNRFTTITLPDSMLSIGKFAFNNCYTLTSVTIPASVQHIGAAAFSDCHNLSGIWVVPENPYYSNDDNGVLFNKDQTELLAIPASISGTYTIADTVVVIGQFAFYRCAYLNEVIIGSGVTRIENHAFNFCSRLTNIVIPDNVTYIGTAAFTGCVSLASITIGTGLRYVDTSAFYGCNSLTGVYISDIGAWCSITFADSNANPLYAAKKLYLNGILVTDLVIPEGVTHIGAYAFYYYTELQTVTLPAGLTRIGDYAFYRCTNLQTVTIGNGLTHIDDYAFAECSNLRQISIPDSIISIADTAFNNCPLLEYAVYDGAYYLGNRNNPYAVLFKAADTALTACTVHPQTRIIYTKAFYNCSALTGVILPNGLHSIGAHAFERCTSLASITIPNSILSIGSNAFFACSKLEHVYISDLAAWCNIAFADYSANPLYKGRTNLYLNNVLVTDLVISDVNHIGNYAFYGYTLLQTLVIEDGITRIGDYAFANCASLETVLLSNDVIEIGNGAFDGNRRLNSITLGDHIRVIGNYAFNNCASLKEFTIPESVITIGEYAFSNCSAFTNIYIPASVQSIGAAAFFRCYSLLGIWVDKDNAWYCNDASGVLFNKDKTVLIVAPGKISGDYVIPYGVITIDNYAFRECEKLTSIVIPDTTITLGANAFSGCNALTSVTFGNSLTNIGYYAFYNCNNLISVTIPDSVVIIESHAFYTCDNLVSVVIGNGVTVIDDDAFGRCPKLVNLVFGSNVQYIENNAFEGCESLTTVVLPDRLISLGYWAFSDCTNLVSVYLPASLTNINLYAFDECTALWHVLYQGTEAQWNQISISNGNTYLIDAVRHYRCTGEEIVDLETRLCTRCCEHDWNDWFIQQEPTCTTTGSRVHTCQICGVTVTQQIPALGHSGDWSIDQQPTCTEEGSRHLTCTTCGAVVHETIAALGHNHTAAITAPTCTEQGYTTHTCHCGDTYVDSYVDSLGHNLGSWYIAIAPGCTSTGQQRRDCSRCDYHEIDHIAATGHSYIDEVTPPTCTQQGYTTHTCHCGDTYVDSYVAALGHAFDAWITDQEPTCTVPGSSHHTCTACGYTESKEIPVIAHSYGDWVTDQEPTCTAPGRCHQICTVCGYTESKEIPMVDHSYGNWITDEYPTCTTPGKQHRTCSACTDTQTQMLPATGHKPVHHDGKGATCTEHGWEAYDTCENCDYSTYVEIPATGHSYTSVVTAPTCTENGYTTHTCHCGNNYVDSYVNALGHKYGSWYTINAPTCTENGEERHDCIRGDHYETRVIPATGHSLVHHNYRGATCTEYGWAAYDTCKNCDYTTYVEIPATGHSYTSVVTAPTCTEQGYTTHTCHCGERYVDSYVDALGHNYEGGICTHCAERTDITGVCGDNLTWILTSNNILTISGTGDMWEFGPEGAPWRSFGNEIVTVIIEEGVTGIGSLAFDRCYALTDITMPDSLTYINHFAFQYCYNLTSIVIGSGVTNIGNYAFSECTGLTSITIPNGITDIGAYAFSECYGLVSIVIPDTVTNIHLGAFKDCTNLISITIPSSVTYIGSQVFQGCNQLWHVLFTGTTEQWNNILIGEQNDSLTTAIRHDQCTCNEIVDLDNRVCILCCQHNRGDLVEVQATCTEAGYTGFICTICGCIVKEAILPATGHSFTNYISDGNATTEKDGTKTAHCDHKCGATHTVTDVGSQLPPAKITSDVYTIHDGYISKIPVGITVVEFAKGIQGIGIQFLKNGSLLPENAMVGTGMVVQLVSNGKVVDSLIVIVTGDTNGDGSISITDMLAVKAHILKKTLLTGAAAKAADVNRDSTISITDFIQIKAQILGKSQIQPATAKEKPAQIQAVSTMDPKPAAKATVTPCADTVTISATKPVQYVAVWVKQKEMLV